MSAPFDNKLAASSASAIVLTADEQRILLAFRTMNARRKRENLELLVSDAADYPERARPALRLVSGGVQ